MTEKADSDHVQEKAYKVFLAAVSLVIVILIAAIALGTVARNNAQIKKLFLEQGRVLFRQISLTRIWAAQYGGVYVLKSAGVESNPWLLGPDINTDDGRVLTLRNPAVMTREISDLSLAGEGYSFKPVSLKAINPANYPDSFEEAVLLSFDQGKTEAWATVNKGPNSIFRYMAALKTRESCLSCHAKQGYKLGDVRGAISISIDVTKQLSDLKLTALMVFALAVLTTVMTLWLVYLTVRRLRRKLAKAYEDLAITAITDGLSGLLNRKEALKRLQIEMEKAQRPGIKLAAAIIDADNFKSINDNFGHASGDAAIKSIAKAMNKEARIYDIAARFGGEEFLMVFPGSSAEGAFSACERIRETATELGKEILDENAKLTLSIGIAEYPFEDDKTVKLFNENDREDKQDAALKRTRDFTVSLSEILLLKADRAMYEAKKAGKNRCVIYKRDSMPLS
ncbi:hypothetical protein MASR2M29_22420 [Spirochaetota bacterium]